MKKFFISLSFLFFAASAVIYAQENCPSLFQQAGQYYEKGQYKDAINIYESLVSQKQINSALYYNLANAYYKTQSLGKAVLNYERALRLSPRDKEIRYNLSFLRQQVKEPQPSVIILALNYFTNLITLNTLLLLCSCLYIFLTAGFIIYLFNKNQLLLLSNLFIFFILILSAGWLSLKVKDEIFTKSAVVLSGPADVRNGPGSENSVGFTVPEGRKVVVLGQKDDWYAIGLTVEGFKGWIEKKYIEKI